MPGQDDIVLRIPIDPRNLPPGTADSGNQFSPTSGADGYTKEVTAKGVASTAFAIQIGRNVAGTVKGLVGDLTGSDTLQRRIDNASKLVGYGVTIASLGAAGAVIVGLDVAAQEVKNVIDANNRNVDAGYQQQLRGASLRGNR